MKVTIIDYGMSNLGSIRRSFEECGAEVLITDTPHDLKQAERIVLPGVGSFTDGMKNLTSGGWLPILQEEVINNKIPLLGICLGMQLLASKGYEGGETPGLSFISGEVRKLTDCHLNERIPHVGWNEIDIVKKESPLLKDINTGTDFYFVHSYHFVPSNQQSVVAVTPYCNSFVSIVADSNIYGTQFHPEKSQTLGLRLLKNFLDI